jgi:hypothetical protein
MRRIVAIALVAVAFGSACVVTRPACADAAADAQKAAAALVERMGSADAETKKKAFGDALDVQHALVTAALVKSLNDPDQATRTAAIAGLAARNDEAGKKAADAGLSSRLERIVKKAELASERLALISALGHLAQPSALKALTAETGFDVPDDELRARLLAVANLPCKEAVEAIIKFALTSGRAGDGQDERRRTAAAAFSSATGQDMGHDAIKMKNWWKEHEKDFDFKAAAERRAKDRGK